MLLIARVVRRGSVNQVFDETTDPIERERGHRNALVRTPSGQIFHIHDRQFHNLTKGCQLPQLCRNNKGPGRFPRHDGGLVVIDSHGATARHGRNPEVRRWMLATEFRLALGRSFGMTGYIRRTMNASAPLTTLVMDLIDDTYGPTSVEEWRALELRLHRLQLQHGIDAHYMQFLKSYFLLGVSEDTAYQLLSLRY